MTVRYPWITSDLIGDHEFSELQNTNLAALTAPLVAKYGRGLSRFKEKPDIEKTRWENTFCGALADVTGIVHNLSAIALSVKPGGSAERIKIKGGLKTYGKAFRQSSRKRSFKN